MAIHWVTDPPPVKGCECPPCESWRRSEARAAAAAEARAIAKRSVAGAESVSLEDWLVEALGLWQAGRLPAQPETARSGGDEPRSVETRSHYSCSRCRCSLTFSTEKCSCGGQAEYLPERHIPGTHPGYTLTPAGFVEARHLLDG